jgi:hypothetical protein
MIAIIVLGVLAFILLCALVGVCAHTETTPAVPAPPPVDLHATVLDPLRSSAEIAPTGREVFFPPPPHAGAVCQATITGVLCGPDGKLGDAFYATDGDGNFRWGVDWLYINGSHSPSTLEFLESDRYLHRYTIRFDAPHGRPTIALARRPGWSGSLTLEFAVLPESTPGVGERRQREKVRAEAEQASARVAQKFAAQIQALVIRAELFRNWEDPAYRERFARAHYDDLIKSQAEIRTEARELFEQHDLVQYLRRHNPAVVERFVGRLEALFLAERIALDKRLGAEQPASPQALAPRKKFTPDEVRAIKVRRQQVVIGDRVALKLDKVETRLQIRDRLAQMPFEDDDERDAVEQELLREIEEGDDDGNGKTL